MSRAVAGHSSTCSFTIGWWLLGLASQQRHSSGAWGHWTLLPASSRSVRHAFSPSRSSIVEVPELMLVVCR